MKLTYTIEVDVVRESGPNVPRKQVSAEIVNRLIEVGQQSEGPNDVILPGSLEVEDSGYAVREWTVYPHEGSEAE